MLILAIPVLGCLIIGASEVVEARDEAATTSEQARLVRTAAGPTSLTTSLIDERTIHGLERAGLQDQLILRIGNATEARQATDDQIDVLQDLIADSDEARDLYEPVLDSLIGDIDDMRANVDSGTDPAETDAQYTSYVTELLQINAAAVDSIDEPEFRAGAQLSELATRQKQTRASIIDALLPPGMEGRPLTTAEQASIGGQIAVYDKVHKTIRKMATGEYRPAGDLMFEALSAADISDFTHASLATGRVEIATFYYTASYKEGLIYEMPSGDYIHDYFREVVVDQLNAKAEQRSDAAASRSRLYTAVGAIALVGAVIINWLVARSITRPMRSVTRQAIDMAHHRLPASVQEIRETPLGQDVVLPFMPPIKANSRDEVADVAAALNTMQQAALALAVDQAVLLRNTSDSMTSVSQRNQELLRRQIEFITELELHETDPATLSNLFELDHMATRMRRYAESLLLLAGINPAGKQVSEVPIHVLVRAAAGETEDYRRVSIGRVDRATIVGSATASLSHLLAELLDDAMTFSPSDEPVTFNGQLSGAGYLLMVGNVGPNLDPEAINLANRRFAGAESDTVAPSKYFSHYIVGALAQQLGITVRLNRAAGRTAGSTGTTVTIHIPDHLLIPDTASPQRTPPPSEAPVVGPLPADPAPPDHQPAPAPALPIVDPATPHADSLVIPVPPPPSLDPEPNEL